MKKIRQRKKISKCKALRSERDQLRSEMIEAQIEAERYKKRLFVIGLDEDLEYLPGLSLPTIEEEIPIDTVQYGNFAAVCEYHEQFTKDIANRLSASIGRALIEQNIARIIVKPKGDGFDPLQEFGTVSVKLTVVPWEQVTSRRLIYRGGYHDQELSQGKNTEVGV